MADKKISQLTALSAANLAPSTDVLAIVDTSATETKKIVAQDLINGVLNVASAVGIGTASPGAPLHVSYTGQAGLRLSNTSGTPSDWYLQTLNGGVLRWYSYTASTERMQIDGSGNLGLGVTPSAWYSGVYTVLDVGASSSFGGFSVGASGDELTFVAGNVYYNSSNNPIYKADGLATNYRQFNGMHQWYTAPSGTAGNAISFTQALTLDASGNLGVGIAPGTSTRRLIVYGSTAAATATSLALQTSTSGTGSTDGFTMELAGTTAYLWNYENDALLFGTNNAERGRFTAGGDLLVGNTVSVQSSRAEFTSTSLTPAFLARVDANSDEGQWAGQFQKKTATNTTSQIFVRFLINDGAAASGYITANGASAATFTSSSDARLKENIVDLPPQLSNILALKPVEFDYKDGSGHQIGFIAQDLQEVYPDCVSEGPDGMLQIGGWSKTEARLVKALQEAMARIESLEAKVAALEAK